MFEKITAKLNKNIKLTIKEKEKHLIYFDLKKNTVFHFEDDETIYMKVSDAQRMRYLMLNLATGEAREATKTRELAPVIQLKTEINILEEII